MCFDCGRAGRRHAHRRRARTRCTATPTACRSSSGWADAPCSSTRGCTPTTAAATWEAHFRETAAHNTAKVDGRDQARHIRKMAWSHSYRARLRVGRTGPSCWVVGSHDGYARGPNGVVHRRAVWLRPDSYMLIYDEFIGTGDTRSPSTSSSLQVRSPPPPRRRRAVRWLRRFRLGKRAGLEITVARGGPGPGDGWIARSLGIQRAAPKLTLSSHPINRAPRCSRSLRPVRRSHEHHRNRCFVRPMIMADPISSPMPSTTHRPGIGRVIDQTIARRRPAV